MKIYFLCGFLCVSLSLFAVAQGKTGESDLGIFDTEIEEDEGDAPPVDKTVPAPMDAERSKKISGYFDEALKNYEDILNSRPEAEVKTTEKRIESIQKLLEEQERGLGVSETSLRKIKLVYLKQYLHLKAAYEEGKIDEKSYYQRVDDLGKKYAHEIDSLKDDVEYYKTQSEKTSAKLKEQEEINRVNKIFWEETKASQPGEQPDVIAEPERTPTELEMLIPRIEAAGCFQQVNGGRLPVIK